jgi:hypothetical protein
MEKIDSDPQKTTEIAEDVIPKKSVITDLPDEKISPEKSKDLQILSQTLNKKEPENLLKLKKGDLVTRYLKICEANSKKPKYPKWKLKSNIKKEEIIQLIDEFDNKEIIFEIDKQDEKKSSIVHLSGRAKKNAASFIVDLTCIGTNILENVNKQYPNSNIDIDGLSYELMKRKKTLIPMTEGIIDQYPVVGKLLDPILVYLTTIGSEALKQNSFNKTMKKKKINPKSIKTLPIQKRDKNISNNTMVYNPVGENTHKLPTMVSSNSLGQPLV